MRASRVDITKQVSWLLSINSNGVEIRHSRIAVAVCFFCQGLCFSSWASRIPEIKETLGLSEAALGSILFALPLGQLSAMPFTGRWVAEYGSRRLLMVGLPLYLLALINLGFAQSGLQLALSLYLYGVAGNLSNISVNTQAVEVEKMYGRPIMASFHGIWSVAGFTGALIGLLLIKAHVSPIMHFAYVSIGGLSMVLLAGRYLVSGRSPMVQKKSRLAMPEGVLVVLGIIGFCCMATEGTMFDWSGVYFKNVIHAKGAMVTLGYVAFMITMASGRFFGDKLIARYGVYNILIISGLLIFSGLMTAVIFPNIFTATLGFVIVGLGVCSVIPMIFSTTGKISSLPPSVALASVSSISYLGFLMGPPIIGFIAEALDLRASFALIALFGIIITLMVSWLKRFR